MEQKGRGTGMIDIVVCIFGIVGILVCRVIENVMWECDYEKALEGAQK